MYYLRTIKVALSFPQLQVEKTIKEEWRNNKVVINPLLKMIHDSTSLKHN